MVKWLLSVIAPIFGKAGSSTDEQSMFCERCRFVMKRIVTLETRDLIKSAENGGCGECQTSCQSACKTSCGIANQQCENADETGGQVPCPA
jgi:predicted ribosomally synthesized six-cysteine peptide SCIFF